MKYPDFCEAIERCLEEGQGCFLSRSDFSAAFRNLGVRPQDWMLLIMKAQSLIDNEWYYFIDKCLPFEAAISCAIFQSFSNAVAHLVRHFTRKKPVNYLDDYLFIALLRMLCNRQVDLFMEICDLIRFPINIDKTFRADTSTTFLGFLIDTMRQIVAVPCEKITKGTNMINHVLQKKNSKVTVLQLQKICGFLNFLSHAVVPGRAFTRRMYSRIDTKLKPHHHIRIDKECRLDMQTWLTFLRHPSCYCRDFMDFTTDRGSEEDFFSDASKNPDLGMGAKCQSSWMWMQWDGSFIKLKDPSIEYLELYALTAAVIAWLPRYKNRCITIFCDNQSVVAMINNTASSCKNCMVLIRLIVLQSMIHNVRLFAKYIPSKENLVSDCLLRLKFDLFEKYKVEMNLEEERTPIPDNIWPMSKLWIDQNFLCCHFRQATENCQKKVWIRFLTNFLNLYTKHS